jgi:hypothetical protein
MKAHRGSGGIALCFFTSALDGGEFSASRTGRFTPRERAPGTHWIGGWVGPRDVLDPVVRKIPSSRRDSNPYRQAHSRSQGGLFGVQRRFFWVATTRTVTVGYRRFE